MKHDRRFPFAFALLLGLLLVPGGAATSQNGPVTRTIEVVAKRYSFSPGLIEVPAGAQVTLLVRSADTVHGLAIRKLGVKREVPRGGSPVSITFTAGSPGTYHITCSEYCGPGHDDMEAVLVVLARP